MKIYKQVDEHGNILYFNKKGQLHREDGPAAEYTYGFRQWCINGKLHRTDGPAREYSNGHKEWYINGEQLSEEEFKRRTTRLSKALYL